MRFALEWRDRPGGSSQTGLSVKTPRRFLDYIVDGNSLYEQHGADFISPLGWLSPDEDEAAARRLLLQDKPDIGDRVALYICPECGDLLCGAVTVLIEKKDEEVIWRDLAMSAVDWGEGEWRHDSTGVSEFGELRFSMSAYFDAIRDRPKLNPQQA